MPKVSVIIPIWNVEDYLRQCLDSVVNQTLRDIEIICVDDGSTDGSPAILAEYAAKDPRVRVLTRASANAGDARNAGVAIATGEYLGFVDSDDWCELALFEKAYARAKEANADVVIWRNDHFDVRRNRLTAPFRFHLHPEQIIRPIAPHEIRHVIFAVFPFAPWCRLVRHEHVRREALSFQSVQRSNDVLFGCLTLATASRIALMDEVLYHYRTGTRMNLQSGNDFSVGDVVRVWKAVGHALEDRQLMRDFRVGYFNAAANSFFYTLGSLTNVESYRTLFAELKELFATDPLLSSCKEGDIRDAGARLFVSALRATDNPIDFLLRLARFDRRRFTMLWREADSLRAYKRDNERKLEERESARREWLRLETLPLVSVAVVDGDESDVAAVRNQAPESGEVFLVEAPDGGTLAGFDEALERANGRYMALLGSGERYLRDGVLEILCLTANVNGAHVCGGTGGVSSYVFDRAWLQERQFHFADYPSASTFLAAVRSADRQSIVLHRQVIVDAVVNLLQTAVPEDVDPVGWGMRAGRMLFAYDRLDLAGEFLERWHDLVLARKLSPEIAGAVVNAFGYPFLEALVSEKARARGVLTALRKWSVAAAGDGVTAFRDAELPALAVDEPMKGLRPGLSVVIPVYNCEAYLVRAIESVRKQTSDDWEIVCVDDGSTDCSPEILDYYARFDGRIRVFHKPNSGVSDTRNLGLEKVRGRYVAFLDGDDWYEPGMVASVLSKADEHDLELCMFDFRCRDFATLESQYHFWTFGHLYENWGVGDAVFSSRELAKWWYYGSLCQMAWKVDFLKARNARFPRIPLGEDVALMSALFPFVRRGYVINRTFYNYQRGEPTSAVTRHNHEKGLSFVRKYETLLGIYRDVYQKETDEATRAKFVGRIISDILYDCSVAPVVHKWMLEVGVVGFGLDRIPHEYLLRPMHADQLARMLVTETPGMTDKDAFLAVPQAITSILRWIERRRDREKRKDLIIVAPQLTSTNDEAVDSWSYFTYLKEIGREAKFVINARHRRCGEFQEAFPRDVIALSDADDLSYDFVRKCRRELVRAKAVAVEWTLSNPHVMKWLSELDGLVYAFLQHGLTYNPPRPVHLHWWRPFNLINFCSERERDLVLGALGNPPGIRSVVAGLPRWDLLKDEQDAGHRVLFVMLTWRPTYNLRAADFWTSAYWRGLKALFSPARLVRFAEAGLTVKLALHHALRSLDMSALDFGQNVEIVEPQTVSYWIRHSAMLLTDFSSVSFDFLYLQKPVVYWIPDRYDGELSAPDREKVMVADGFLKSFIGQAHSADEAVNRVVDYARGGFSLSAEDRAKIAPFFSDGGEFRRRITEAIDSICATSNLSNPQIERTIER